MDKFDKLFAGETPICAQMHPNVWRWTGADTRDTASTVHLPPRAVATRRSFNARAIPFNEVTPDERTSSIIGSVRRAKSSAAILIALRADIVLSEPAFK